MHSFNMPAHGGDLAWACETFGIPTVKWLDLSTGIAPWTWPVPDVPLEVWRSLPPNDGMLENAAADYFGCETNQLLALPGSQFLISRLPYSLPTSAVAIPKIAYSEHEIAWRKAGHEIHLYENEAQLTALVEHAKVSSAVVVQPNNPTGFMYCPDNLIALQKTLWERHTKHGVFLVDEAFIDLKPELSLCLREREENCLVLRSLGKFFGLAGLRLGFLCAHSYWRNKFKSRLEPWLVSHPARWIGSQALRDTNWIIGQRKNINNNSAEISICLRNYFGLNKSYTQGLFHSVLGSSDEFKKVFVGLAQQGILTRYFELDAGNAILRFGLPGSELPRLKHGLEKIDASVKAENLNGKIISSAMVAGN